jgi:hypothetical protein
MSRELRKKDEANNIASILESGFKVVDCGGGVNTTFRAENGTYVVKTEAGQEEVFETSEAAANRLVFGPEKSAEEKEIAEITNGRWKGKVLCDPRRVLSLNKLLRFIGEEELRLAQYDGCDELIQAAGIPERRYKGYHHNIHYQLKYNRAVFDAWSDSDYTYGREHSDSSILDLTDPLIDALLKKAKNLAFVEAVKRWEKQEAETLKTMRRLGAREVLDAVGLLEDYDG